MILISNVGSNIIILMEGWEMPLSEACDGMKTDNCAVQSNNSKVEKSPRFLERLEIVHESLMEETSRIRTGKM